MLEQLEGTQVVAVRSAAHGNYSYKQAWLYRVTGGRWRKCHMLFEHTARAQIFYSKLQALNFPVYNRAEANRKVKPMDLAMLTPITACCRHCQRGLLFCEAAPCAKALKNSSKEANYA